MNDDPIARAAAQPVIELAIEESQKLPQAHREAFWQRLYQLAWINISPDARALNTMQPMTDRVAIQFAKTQRIPDGKFRGRTVADLAISNPQALQAMAHTPRGIELALRRFLANPNWEQLATEAIKDLASTTYKLA
jgi:hypothetical protein